MAMSMKTSGFEDIQRELKLMQQAIRDEVIMDAINIAGKVMADEMQARAPVLSETTARSTALKPGQLKAGICVRVSKTREGAYRAVIGPRKGTGRAAHLVEYGHRLVKGGRSRIGPLGVIEYGAGEKDKKGRLIKNGHEIGEVPAHPFLRPAYESTERAVVDQYVCELREILRPWLVY